MIQYTPEEIKNILIDNFTNDEFKIIENLLEVHMGDGWYKGRIGLQKDGKQDDLWGSEYKLCAPVFIY